jgi:hypothetical protein
MKARLIAVTLSACACSGLAGSDSREGHLDAVLPAIASPAAPREADPQPSGWAWWNALRGDAYELDSIERHLGDSTGKVVCRPETMMSYAGTGVRYHGAIEINPLFRERLERFELLLSETALEVYGRAPRRIRHFGAYSCRSSRNRNYRVSEHALGNAIDIVGFDFAPATKQQPLSAELPRQLRGAFEVRVARHWTASSGATAAVHARFLRLLIERLQDRDNVFRGLIGPGRPGHADHFHFDVSPWRYVRL